MKKNTLIGLSLFFLGSFALIAGALRFPSVEFYTGGIVIACFIAGLFYSWGNAIRQAKEIEQSSSKPASAAEPQTSEGQKPPEQVQESATQSA